MIEISKEKYNYCYVDYADVNIGDTFVGDDGNVYIKIPWVNRSFSYAKDSSENKTVGNKEFSIEEKEYSCVSLRDGKLQKFLDKTKVYLVNCKMKWDYNRAEKKSNVSSNVSEE